MSQALDLTPLRDAVKADLPPRQHALADLTVDVIGGLFRDVGRIADALEALVVLARDDADRVDFEAS